MYNSQPNRCTNTNDAPAGIYLDQDGDDGLQGFVNHLETVLVIVAENAGTHEGEDWHQVVQNTALQCKKKAT